MATRRAVLATAGASLLAGCGTTPDDLAVGGGGGKPPGGVQLIDAHCHLFNVKDLSAVRFIAYTILKQYPDAGGALYAQLGLTGPDDPTFLDRIIRVLLDLVGARRAPSARTELAYLTRQAAPLAAVEDEDRLPIDEATQRQTLIDDTTAFLGGAGRTGDAQAEATVRTLIVQAGGGPVDLEPRVLFELPEAERRAMVVQALTVDDDAAEIEPAALLAGPPLYLPGLIDFIVQLKRYRHQLVGELARRHARQGQTAALLVPAMVDFGRWLRDDPAPTSTLAEQVAVWGEISRRRDGPAVHGHVGFCPLRHVLHERTGATGESPLGLVERALDQQGFLGVKLYPPMGFSATRNGERTAVDPPVSHEVLELVFGEVPTGQIQEKTRELGRALDAALDRLYRLCEAPDRRAVIIAHGGNSVGAGARTGELADPYYWKGVFDRPNGPAVMLGHFGGFSDTSADPAKPPAPSPLPQGWRAPAFEHSWEAWLGRYIQANPCKPVFADISMFTDVLPGGPRARSEAGFKRLAAEVPEIVDHLVFGTDWTMLAQAKGAGRYDPKVIAFLRDVFKTDADRNGDLAIEKILRGNFLRYAGLVEDAPAYDRIRRVYRDDRRLNDRLRAACLPGSPLGIASCPSRRTP